MSAYSDGDGVTGTSRRLLESAGRRAAPWLDSCGTANGDPDATAAARPQVSKPACAAAHGDFGAFAKSKRPPLLCSLIQIQLPALRIRPRAIREEGTRPNWHPWSEQRRSRTAALIDSGASARPRTRHPEAIDGDARRQHAGNCKSVDRRKRIVAPPAPASGWTVCRAPEPSGALSRREGCSAVKREAGEVSPSLTPSLPPT